MWEIVYKVKDMKTSIYWPLYRSECKYTTVDGSVLQLWIGFHEAATLSFATVACSSREQLLRDSSQWRERSIACKVQCHHALQSAVNLKSRSRGCWESLAEDQKAGTSGKNGPVCKLSVQPYSTTHLNTPAAKPGVLCRYDWENVSQADFTLYLHWPCFSSHSRGTFQSGHTGGSDIIHSVLL